MMVVAPVRGLCATHRGAPEDFPRSHQCCSELSSSPSWALGATGTPLSKRGNRPSERGCRWPKVSQH